METGVGIQIEGLSKRYGEGETAVDALRDVNMSVAPGEVVGLIGPSGSGKTTLLKCLGAVIEPTRGRMTLGGSVIYDNGWKISDLRVLRRDRIGFIFQAPYLIPFLDVDRQRGAPAHAGGAAQRGRRAPARWSCWRRSTWRIGPVRCPPNSPAASSSGCRLPGRWRTGRR